MNKSFIGIFTVLAFIGSFLLANYFSDHSVNLHTQLNKAIHWAESFFHAEPELIQQPVITEQATAKEQPKKQYLHVVVGNSKACKDTSVGEVKYKKVGEVYTWVDERGIANFSSTPPKKGDYTLLHYAGEKVFDYFNLDLNTENLPYDFHQKLTLKLNKLFEIYGQLLDRSSLKKVDINLKVYSSKVAFDQIKTKYNMPIGDNTPGFYSYATNQAHILLTNHAATMRTATHEAVHAINRGIIGYSPKWLNEGLAEYTEFIEVKGKSTRIYPNQNWTDNGFISEQLLPLDKLLSATESDWKSELSKRLYATSWAFIYFMMENQKRKSMLSQVIKYEQQNLCNVIEHQQIEKVMGVSIHELQSKFNDWANARPLPQAL